MGFVANYVRNLGMIWTGREPIRPLLFSYYVTHRCDLGCRYCCDGDGKRFKEDPVPELDTADVRRLLSILRQGGDTLDITGGEPLVRDDLEEILASCSGARISHGVEHQGHRPGQTAPICFGTRTFWCSASIRLSRPAWPELIGRPRTVADEILAALRLRAGRLPPDRTRSWCWPRWPRPTIWTKWPEVLDFALEHGLGFQLSPEIVGTAVNPALRDNAAYRRVDRPDAGREAIAQRRARRARVSYWESAISRVSAAIRC